MTLRLCFLFLSIYVSQIQADNMALTSGQYSGSMGAGGATALEPIAFGQNPAAFSEKQYDSISTKKFVKALGLRLDFNRPFGIDEMRVSDLGIYCDYNHIGLALAYRETAVQDLYSEKGYQLNPRINVGKKNRAFPGHINLGMQVTYWSQKTSNENGIWKVNQGYGGVWNILPQLALGGFVQGLPLFLGTVSQAEIGNLSHDVLWQCGITVNNSSDRKSRNKIFNQQLHVDMRKIGAMPLRVLGAYSLELNRFVKLCLGISTPTFQFATGVQIGWGGLEWSQALRYHRYLGRTTFSGLAYSFTADNL